MSSDIAGSPAARSEDKDHSATQRRPLKGFVGNIESLTETNSDFRRVLYTGTQLQLVLMSIAPGEEIGEETHGDRDQFFRIEAGVGEVVIDGHRTKIKSDDGIVVPAGARHNLVNTGSDALQLYTIYGPPEHRLDTVQATKSVADAADEHFDGTTSE